MSTDCRGDKGRKRTEDGGVDRLERGERVVEGEDLRRADEGEVPVGQRMSRWTLGDTSWNGRTYIG